MNEAEVESWYEERKELLMERYLAALEKGKDRDKERERYSKAFRRLHADYERQMHEAMELARWRERTRGAEKGWKGVVGFFR